MGPPTGAIGRFSEILVTILSTPHVFRVPPEAFRFLRFYTISFLRPYSFGTDIYYIFRRAVNDAYYVLLVANPPISYTRTQ